MAKTVRLDKFLADAGALFDMFQIILFTFDGHI